MDWIGGRTDSQSNLFWLRGKAGSGKSTIANTVANTIANTTAKVVTDSIAQSVESCEHAYCLSSFSCKRDDVNLSDPHRVLPTLAYRFAQQHPSYCAAIFKLLNSDPRGAGIGNSTDIKAQFEKLFQEPLNQTVDPLRPHVIIIDALDECGSDKDQARLAQCFLELSKVAWIKIFVTSRDDPDIHNAFAAGACIQYNIDEEQGTDQDIQKYIQWRLEVLEIHISTTEIQRLVVRAQGLFIWCRTLFEYLRTYISSARRRELEPFLSGEWEHGPWAGLYGLYDKVLDSAVKNTDDKAFMQALLTVVSAATVNRPLSPKAIACFLDDHEQHKKRTEPEAQDIFRALHAVLFVDQSMNGAIRAYHTSFYDFLELKVTEGSPGWESLGTTHSRMFRRCVDILHTQLRFNICEIEIPKLNKDISDLADRVSKKISEELQYSSRFWFTRLVPSKLTEADAVPGVRDLLCSWNLLFWLESLSLQGSVLQSFPALRACMDFFHVSHKVFY